MRNYIIVIYESLLDRSGGVIGEINIKASSKEYAKRAANRIVTGYFEIKEGIDGKVNW